MDFEDIRGGSSAWKDSAEFTSSSPGNGQAPYRPSAAALASSLADGKITNAMTIDVEDYYQVSAFDRYIKRSSWSDRESRVERNQDRILAMLDEAGCKATFFTLGCVAERHPDVARQIVANGHELASHGWGHQRVTSLSQNDFRLDVSRSKAFLEDLTGVEVRGYRAPSYSVSEQTTWAHEELLAAGYSYSSSVAPIKHDHYGIPTAPRFAYIPDAAPIREVPVSTTQLFGSNYACGGGGWFRLYPYPVTRHFLRKINTQENKPAVFYFHPWEIDPQQPRISGLDVKTRFRHYVNLSSTEGKLQQLLKDFRWGRMDAIYLGQVNNPASSSSSLLLKV